MPVQNKLLSLALASTIGLLFPITALAEQVRLEEGTPVRLTMLEGVSSGRNKEGDSVSLQVVEDVLAQDEKTVLIKSGTPAWGTITNLQERGMLGQKGEIALTVQGTKAVDGKKVLLRAGINRQGASRMGTSIALSLFLTWLCIFIKGKDANIAAGVPVTAYVDKNILVDAQVAAPALQAASATVSPAEAVSPTDAKTVPNYLQKYTETGSQPNSLKALEQLRSQGVLTQAEFETKKKALLEKK